MHKKIIKIISILIIITYILSCASIVFGQEIDPLSVIGSGPNPSSGGVTTLYTLGNTILGIIQYIGAAVAIMATLLLGIRYMYSSPDEKAEVKKKLIPYVIGGILVFGAVQLVKLVEVFTKEITP
ncbi:MAG: hypothetical protein HFJ44_02620 [Clostridia bacterium]|nr:hypothetical protein [Clostridia bacterium]